MKTSMKMASLTKTSSRLCQRVSWLSGPPKKRSLHPRLRKTKTRRRRKARIRRKARKRKTLTKKVAMMRRLKKRRKSL